MLEAARSLAAVHHLVLTAICTVDDSTLAVRVYCETPSRVSSLPTIPTFVSHYVFTTFPVQHEHVPKFPASSLCQFSRHPKSNPGHSQVPSPPTLRDSVVTSPPVLQNEMKCVQ